MHKLETFLLVSAWVVTLASVLFIPRKMAWEASFIFVLTQLFTWILGVTVVECGWIEYPVHELSKANSTSFFFEYLLLPMLAVHFILRYPAGKALWLRIVYFAGAMAAFTIAEVIVERYTLIIKYHGWSWYWTFISMSFVFYFTMVIVKWFFRIRKPFSL